MKAMVLTAPGKPLEWLDVPTPKPESNELLIKVGACGVCRTDLHIIDGELPPPRFPLIIGHEAAGIVIESGAGVSGFAPGERVGVPWLGGTCQSCSYCNSGRENLCDNPTLTGYGKNGGYSEYLVARADYCHKLPPNYSDIHAAPFLCAGLIGFRAYRMVPEATRLGLFGFGAAAHILSQIAAAQNKEVYAFTRPGDEAGQKLALKLGATWSGGSDAAPPGALDAAIIFAPVGALVPAALTRLKKGGLVICAGIHMSDIPQFPYRLLWQERIIRSVANLTREDGRLFFSLLGEMRLATETIQFPLKEANAALRALKAGQITGAAVLVP